LDRYKIFETNEFLKRLKEININNKIFIQKKLTNYIYPQLREEPHYGINIKKLINYKPETWRYRIGKYRVFYIIDEEKKIIYMLSIDLRKDAY
jgi:mRNA interferase RelE/StbE